MSGQNTPPRKKLEKIAKKLVSVDVRFQKTDSFFIDKDVFDEFFPAIKKKIQDSSLSDLILKYDWELHTTELQCVFPPNSSKMCKFNYLKGLHREYGYHLCYMALRESANDHNENEDLVEKMKNKAIALSKYPPSELFSDSPLSSDDDIPQGQGESREQPTEEVGEQSNNQKLHVDKTLTVPVSVNTVTSKEELALNLKDTSKSKQPPSSTRFSSQPYPNHIESCHCEQCRLRRSDSDPGPSSILPKSETLFHRLQSEDSMIKQIKEQEKYSKHNADPLLFAQKSIHRPVPFSAPHEVLPTVKDTSENVSGDNIDQSSTMTAAYESSVKEAARDCNESNIVSGMARTRIEGNVDTNNNNNNDVATDG